MATTLQLKRSSVPGKVPTSLEVGELALNLADGMLFSTTPNGQIFTIGANLVNQSVSGTLTANTVSISGSAGIPGQVIVSTGNGTTWGTLTSGVDAIVRQRFIADGSTFTYTISGGYTANAIDVYVNGVKLVNGVDVDTTTGTTITLQTIYQLGSVIDVIGQLSFSGELDVTVRQNFICDGNTDTFQITDGYTANSVDVFVNGIKMVNGTDVDVSSGNNVILNTTYPNNTQVEVTGQLSFSGVTGYVRQSYSSNNNVTYSVTGGYIPGGIDVWVNGVKLLNGTDVNVSSGNTFTLSRSYDTGTNIDVVGKVKVPKANTSFANTSVSNNSTIYVSNNDFWINFRSNTGTIILPAKSKNGKQYQMTSIAAYSGNPNISIVATSPATIQGVDSINSKNTLVTATYINDVWYCASG